MKKNNKKLTLGAATGIGVGVGTALGVAFDNLSLGIALGVAIVMGISLASSYLLLAMLEFYYISKIKFLLLFNKDKEM